MTDIFISYSSKDREWVHGLANALEQQGYRVWWDTGLLSGDDFHNTIPEKLAEAACVIVVWTPNSVESLWVKAEANRGLRRNVLIPVLAGDTEIPIPFDMLHTDNFQAWQGDTKPPEFKRLLLSVARYTEPSLLLEQAQREAELEAERRRQALAAEAEEQRRQQADVEQRKAEQQKREQAARDAKRREEAQRQREARAQAEKQRLAEEQRRKDAAVARKARSDSAQSTPISTVAPKPSAVTSRSPQKAGIGKGLTWGGVGTVAMVVALFIWNGRESLFPEQPDEKPTTVGVLSEQSSGSTPDTSGFQAVADPAQLGKPDFPVPEMVRIEGGSFEMGCVSGQSCRDREKPVHTVNVPSFEIGKYEVTFDEWDACVTDGGCKHKPDDRGWGRGKRPVINVSWNDVQNYTQWLSKQVGKSCRLPSEAEWEYSARAGTKTAYPWGNEVGNNRANCDGCGSQWDNKQTAPVGSLAANAWGLHDMNGNVWEWVQDHWHSDYQGAPTDGSAWSGTLLRVVRGGSWGSGPDLLRSAIRLSNRPDVRSSDFGFRVLCSPPYTDS